MLAAAACLAAVKGVGRNVGRPSCVLERCLARLPAHPLLGSGAGTFERAWLHYRALPSATVDAHNLYLETLAELGPFGLFLLAAVLAVPLTAVATARRRDPLAVAAAGAYIAFLAHAAVDWDWEMPVVTLVALVCAVVVLKAGRTEVARSPRVSMRAVVSGSR